MKEIYNFEFWRWNFDCDTFKQKHALLIKNLIEGSRLNNEMYFNSYGQITFDDTDVGHKYPKIQSLENFSRSKTNCLIFNLRDTYKNPGKYDKCFIYHSAGPQEGSYGYVFYNTNDGSIYHKYFITHKMDELCIKLSQKFTNMFDSIIYDFYSNKFDIIQKRKEGEVPSYLDEIRCREAQQKLFQKYI